MITRTLSKVGLLHYSAPPVIGGVEGVIVAHTDLFIEAGFSTTVFVRRGEQDTLPAEAKLINIPELDSQHPQIVEMPIATELRRVSDALVMPSRREGFGMPILEAGLAGVPIFCSARLPAAKEGESCSSLA